MFEEIIKKENIEKSYKQCMKGKCKYKKDAMIFDRDKEYNIKTLIEKLKNEEYNIGKYKKFKVYEPKERIIYAPYFEDKFVQVMLNNVLKKIYNPCFIFDSYACIDFKGTHKASERIKNFIKRAKYLYGKNAYAIKIDIKKYFYTIDRKILRKIIFKKIKCKNTRFLIDKILNSVPEEKGIPLGNITSHLFANIYLNELDQFCKRKLGIKFYVRYMDDVLLIVKDKNTAINILKKIKEFCNIKLNLILHENKTLYFPIKQGVNMIGFKTHSTHKLLRNKSKKNIKRKLSKMKNLILQNKMSIKKTEQILNSWYGHCKLSNNYNFINKITHKYDYIFFDNKFKVKINS